jgi:uncharacterized protein YndB with AHSA1/START domain
VEGAEVEISREMTFEAPADEVWAALTESDRLEDWFATEAELEPVEGGRASFRWGNGEERSATIEVFEPERCLELLWDDDGGRVVLELEESDDRTTLRVRETTPEFGAALELRALAACAVA